MHARIRSGSVRHPDDQQFWCRMNSRDPAMDSPGMSCSESLPFNSAIDVIVATAAGKPLLHFGHHGKESNRRDGSTTRSLEELVSLSAACVAFRHATKSRIRSIAGPCGLIFSTNFGALHVAVAASDRSLPLDYLVSLATVTVTSIFFLLSSGFITALESRPTLDLGSKALSIQNFTAQFLKRAILFPLPCAFEASVSLPCAMTFSIQKRLGSILTSTLRTHPSVTHALILSASPPFPHRIISCVSPVYNPLSPMDQILICSLLPHNIRQKLDLPQRIFLQAFSFNKASVLIARSVELRLASADFEEFKSAVGGEDWRPDWSESGADAVWIVGICAVSAESNRMSQKSGEAFLNDVEKRLDRSTAAKDLMVNMERPWRVSDTFAGNPILSNCVLGIIMRGSRRMVATVGALKYKWGIEVLRVVKQCRSVCDGRSLTANERSRLLVCVFCKDANIWLVAASDKYVFVSGMVSEARAVEICKKYVFPWLSVNASSLFSQHSYIGLPPKTPLAAFLAPFES